MGVMPNWPGFHEIGCFQIGCAKWHIIRKMHRIQVVTEIEISHSKRKKFTTFLPYLRDWDFRLPHMDSVTAASYSIPEKSANAATASAYWLSPCLHAWKMPLLTGPRCLAFIGKVVKTVRNSCIPNSQANAQVLRIPCVKHSALPGLSARHRLLGIPPSFRSYGGGEL